MGNNSQLYIFLLIAAFSVIQWVAKQIKEQREVRKINEARRKMRESGVMETPTPSSTLAQEQKDHLRKMRERHAQRLRERQQQQASGTQVQAGQPPATPSVQRAPLAKRPVRTPRPASPKPTPRPVPQRTNRRPLRPGRTARQPSIADPPAPTSRVTPVKLNPDHTVLGALDHKALLSEGGVATDTTGELARATVAKTDWKRAIVLSEILAPPVSMRKPEES